MIQPRSRMPASKAVAVTAATAQGGAAKAGEVSVAGQSIRVNVDVIEQLMTMVSELVLTRNQLLQILRSQQTASSRFRCSA
jgi:two-component system chemotaxis sensor kinase CheA